MKNLHKFMNNTFGFHHNVLCIYYTVHVCIISDGRGGRLDEIQLSILQTPHHSTALEAGADIVAGEEIFKEVHCTCMYTCTFAYDVYTDSSLTILNAPLHNVGRGYIHVHVHVHVHCI